MKRVNPAPGKSEQNFEQLTALIPVARQTVSSNKVFENQFVKMKKPAQRWLASCLR
jgi:hypothetical protein